MDNDNNELESKQLPNRISENRRKITKAGLLAAPVITSLSARPVFGAQTQCLSNMLSGNLSDPAGGQCNYGLSPGYWKEHPEDWMEAGCVPAMLKSNGSMTHRGCVDCKRRGRGGCVDVYDDGGGNVYEATLFNDVFGGEQDGQNRSMFTIMCDDNGSDMFHIIAAYLNSRSPLIKDYVMSTAQVLELWEYKESYDGISDFKAFLNSTWT